MGIKITIFDKIIKRQDESPAPSLTLSKETKAPPAPPKMEAPSGSPRGGETGCGLDDW